MFEADLFYRSLQYATSSATELNSIGGWIKPEGSDEALLYSPSGDLVIEETDAVVKSRGFDFTVTRTYRSGSQNFGSVLGPNWHLNHDRKLIWDTFNNTLMVSTGNGSNQVFEQVQGEDYKETGDKPADRRVFTQLLGGTEIAIHHPVGNRAIVTRNNPRLKGCISARNNTVPTALTGNSEGFIIRDKVGNLAFYTPYRINDKDEDWCQRDRKEKLFGRQNMATRNGELKYYKLAYIQDAKGNRQNYYYNQADVLSYEPEYSPDASYIPGTQLSCVVDTEGRGYSFDMQWTCNNETCQNDRTGLFASLNAKYINPWLNSIRSQKGVLAQYAIAQEGQQTINNMDGLLLRNVSNETKGDLEYEYYTRTWHAERQVNNPSSLLKSISVNKKTIRTFDYELPDTTNVKLEDTDYPYHVDASDYRYYKTKLTAINIIHFAGGGVQRSKINFFYREKGITRPASDDLQAPFGWVTIERNGRLDTFTYNRMYHLIEHKKAYWSKDAGAPRQHTRGPICSPVRFRRRAVPMRHQMDLEVHHQLRRTHHRYPEPQRHQDVHLARLRHGAAQQSQARGHLPSRMAWHVLEDELVYALLAGQRGCLGHRGAHGQDRAKMDSLRAHLQPAHHGAAPLAGRRSQRTKSIQIPNRSAKTL